MDDKRKPSINAHPMMAVVLTGAATVLVAIVAVLAVIFF